MSGEADADITSGALLEKRAEVMNAAFRRLLC
jgi:hypothetical protein